MLKIITGGRIGLGMPLGVGICVAQLIAIMHKKEDINGVGGAPSKTSG